MGRIDNGAAGTNRVNDIGEGEDEGAAYLAELGRRLRRARARRGMTRKALAAESAVSERHLAGIEAGRGNASILLLRRIAKAMGLPLGELTREGADLPVTFDLIVERLEGLGAAALGEVRGWLECRFGEAEGRAGRIALVGLRGAGKSTLGAGLANRLAVPFVQLDQEVAARAGMPLDEVFGLLGQAAYRRLEREALEHLIATTEAAVIEAGGGIVAEAGTYRRLLERCHVVWLHARSGEHMARVVAQGDSRPIAGSHEAMADLERILEGRRALYAQAARDLDTSGGDVAAVLDTLDAITAELLAAALP